jgi:hypothetical protein
MDTERLAKLLALTASSGDGEALNALRLAQKAVAESGGTWTELMDVRVRLHSDDIENRTLRQRITGLRQANQKLRAANLALKQQLAQVQAPAAPPVILKRPEAAPVIRKRPEATSTMDTASRPILKRPEAPKPPELKRPKAAIAAVMRKILSDPELARLSDRELARRTGLSPTTVGAWRRRGAS